MFICILFISVNVFLYTMQKNAQFRDVAGELNQIDVERIREDITVSDANFTAEEDQVSLRAQLRNDGAVRVELLTLWIVQATTEKYG